MYEVFDIGGHIEMVIESFKSNIREDGLINDVLASSPIYLLDSSLCIGLLLPADGSSYVYLSLTGFTLTDKGIVNLIKVETDIEGISMES